MKSAFAGRSREPVFLAYLVIAVGSVWAAAWCDSAASQQAPPVRRRPAAVSIAEHHRPPPPPAGPEVRLCGT